MDPVYARNPDFVQRDVAGECLLVPIRRGAGAPNSIYVLNETAASLWKGLDGRATLSAVVDKLHGEFDVERAVLEKDVAALVADLLSVKAVSPRP